MHISNCCSNCTTKTRCRKRDFSEQAWSVLLAWGEVDAEVVDQPVCDDCYIELRNILIDRAVDVERALASPAALKAQIAAAKNAKAQPPAAKKKAANKIVAAAKPNKSAASRSKSAPAKKGKKVGKLAS